MKSILTELNVEFQNLNDTVKISENLIHFVTYLQELEATTFVNLEQKLPRKTTEMKQKQKS